VQDCSTQELPLAEWLATKPKDIYRKVGKKIDGFPPVKQALMNGNL
jgi:hypothetical protein